jgi:glutamyl-tRNA synthetase
MKTKEFNLVKEGAVRVRIAPSPTGYLHMGTARAALFNYLFAKQNQGRFILRMEDTDKARSLPEYEKDIIESLKWLGLDWNEGPDVGGDYGPYRQSEKTDAYKDYLEKLLAENKAYYCFCSQDELEAQKQYHMSIGEAPRYNGKCSGLDKKTVKKYLEEKKPSVIRFRTPAKKIVFEDMIRGKLEFDSGLMGDIVIAKDLLNPLYNFTVVVDDYEMKISHVIRGEDHISNTPKQMLLQEALGFIHPRYGHLPLILGTDRSKMSKRHGDVAVSTYRKEGYLPEAIINFIAFLGWNPGDDKEIYSLAGLIKDFSLEKVQKGGAVFNVKKLEFLNGFYIRKKSLEKLALLCLSYWQEQGLVGQGSADMKYLEKVVALYQERLKKLSEIIELTDFFFKEPEYDKELLSWKGSDDKQTKASLDKLEHLLSKIKEADWNREHLESAIMPEAEKSKDRGLMLWPFRAALSGKQSSAGPFEIASVLGREKTLDRVKRAKNML